MRYFFHLRVGKTLNPDELGLEFPNLETAYLKAFEAAQDMWRELLAERSDPLTRAFEIADEDGHVLLTLPLAEVLERAQKPSLPRTRATRARQAAVQNRSVLVTSLHKKIRELRETAESARKAVEEAILKRHGRAK